MSDLLCQGQCINSMVPRKFEKKNSQMLIFATFSYKFYLKLVCDECQRSQVNNCLSYGLVPYDIPRGQNKSNLCIVII